MKLDTQNFHPTPAAVATAAVVLVMLAMLRKLLQLAHELAIPAGHLVKGDLLVDQQQEQIDIMGENREYIVPSRG